MPAFTRISGAWKRITSIYVRVSGSWKAVTNAWVRDGGSWKLFFSSGGQFEWRGVASTTWTVPAGVTSIHACVVGAGNFASTTEIRRGSTVLLSSNAAVRSSVGGGNGGAVGTSGSGGGAGGYSGNGGKSSPSATAGSGGGGGGGYGSSARGGGVYMHGEGSSGAAGTSTSTQGKDGSNLGEGVCVGAGDVGRPGGSLRYTKTPISVSPGQVLTFYVYLGEETVLNDQRTHAGVRVMWGGGRSYPNNAKDV